MTSAMKISVVVPVRDEAQTIRALLNGLLGQSRPPDEIVLTDGGSVDETRTIIEEFIEQAAPVKLLIDADSLPGRSRNIGVANAKHNWIAFIDAGITPATNWLQALADQVTSPAHAEVVYGSYEPIVDSFFTECAAIAYVPPPAMTEAGPVRPYSIASALMPREAWEKAGGFPEHLRSAEDLIFMQKVEAAGFRIVRAPSALVRWRIQSGLHKTFRRFVIYARNNLRAGLWRQWQLSVFQRYLALALSALPAIYFGPKWFLVTVTLWLMFMLSRAARVIWQNRVAYPASLGRNLLRSIFIVVILGIIDLAMFVGSAIWLVRDSWKTESV